MCCVDWNTIFIGYLVILFSLAERNIVLVRVQGVSRNAWTVISPACIILLAACSVLPISENRSKMLKMQIMLSMWCQSSLFWGGPGDIFYLNCMCVYCPICSCWGTNFKVSILWSSLWIIEVASSWGKFWFNVVQVVVLMFAWFRSTHLACTGSVGHKILCSKLPYSMVNLRRWRLLYSTYPKHAWGERMAEHPVLGKGFSHLLPRYFHWFTHACIARYVPHYVV